MKNNQEIDLKSLVERVAVLRDDRDNLKAVIARLEGALREQNAELYSDRDEIRKELIEAEGDLRNATKQIFRDTGDKKPHPAVGIRVGTRLVYNADDALEWARQNLRSALKLDKKKFEKVMKALGKDRPPFVHEEEKITSTIKSDLSEYIRDYYPRTTTPNE